MSVQKSWLFHDHILVKSGKAPATPWHHDRPYYIFQGNLNLSIWTPIQDVPKGAGMIFLKGSHLSSNLYSQIFKDGTELGEETNFKALDDSVLKKYEHIEFDLKRGDVSSSTIQFIQHILMIKILKDPLCQ